MLYRSTVSSNYPSKTIGERAIPPIISSIWVVSLTLTASSPWEGVMFFQGEIAYLQWYSLFLFSPTYWDKQQMC